jgi:hypothetical protein
MKKGGPPSNPKNPPHNQPPMGPIKTLPPKKTIPPPPKKSGK